MNKEIDIHIDKKFVDDVKTIINNGRSLAYTAVDTAMISTYWSVGRRIVEEEQKGSNRAAYGTKLLEHLSAELTQEYGSGYSARYLAYFRKFYLTIPDISILQTRLQNLRWSHIIEILRVGDEVARRWYLETASEQVWSIKALKRNISTQYYERHYSQPQITENKETTIAAKNTEILKTPFMGEFLGFKLEDGFSEKELESSIISHLKGMYDELKCTEGDSPTIGIVLCSETDEDIARYSMLKGNEQLFATKYKLYLPTEEQLRKEIEHQKDLYCIQHSLNDNK